MVQRPNTRSSRQPSFEKELKARRLPRFVKLLMVLFFIAIFAVGAWFLVFSLISPSDDAREAEGVLQDITIAGFDFIRGEGNRVFIHVKPPLIINLPGAGGRYAMRVQIRLEVDSRRVAEELNEHPAKYHRMVDLMLTALKSRSYAELAYGDGIDKLKEELLAKLSPFVTRGRIIRVLFHELYFAEVLPYAKVKT